MNIKFGIYDGEPVRFAERSSDTDMEVWWNPGSGWRKIPSSGFFTQGREVTEAEFTKTFGAQPDLPANAFHSGDSPSSTLP